MMNFGIKAKGPDKSRNRVGLDIGAYAAKIVEISGAPDRPALVRLGEKKITGLSGEETSDSLKALAEEAKISTKEVCISVSGPSIIVRFITLPRMSGDDLAGAVRFEAEKFIPFNINDCVLDFQKIADESEAKMDCLIAAARREEIDARIALAARAGLTVTAVDVDSFALTNSFVNNFTAALRPERTTAILNIGALYTNLSIVTGSSIAFVRETAVGGNDFNDAIAKKMGMGEDEIFACAKPVLATLADEIKASFGYYENQSGRAVDDIYISGGGSLLPGLEEVFAEAFGIRPNRWNPFGFLDTSQTRPGTLSTEKAKDYFAVAVGLALKVV